MRCVLAMGRQQLLLLLPLRVHRLASGRGHGLINVSRLRAHNHTIQTALNTSKN